MMKEIFAKIIAAGFLLLLFLSRSILCTGQSVSERNNISVIAGIGNFELLHAGILLSTPHFFLETAIGTKPWNFNKSQYIMEYICVGKTLFRPLPELNIALQLKLLHWDYDDDYTQISVLATGAEIKLSQTITSHLKISLTGGANHNMVLRYERKTYEEVGWLNRFSPAFSLQLNYSIL